MGQTCSMWNQYFAVTDDPGSVLPQRVSISPPQRKSEQSSWDWGLRRMAEYDDQTERTYRDTQSGAPYVNFSEEPEKRRQRSTYVWAAILSSCLLVLVLGLLFWSTGHSAVLQPLALQASEAANHIRNHQYRDTRVKQGTPAPDLQRLQREHRWSFGDSVVAGADSPAGSDQVVATPVSPVAAHGDAVATVALMLEDSDQLRQQKQESGRRIETGFFSDLTLVGAAGQEIQYHDDRRCQVAGSRRFEVTQCLGAPYLYVSFHGGGTPDRVRNVCKFTRDGCSMGSVLLPNSIYRPHSLRGLLLHENFLFVAEAWRKDSRVLRFSHCNPWLGHRRELLQELVTGSEQSPESGLIHPYSFAQRSDDPHIYVSVQETGSVLRFHHASGRPGPWPPALRRRMEEDGESDRVYANGTFVLLEPNEEIRGIAFDQQGLLYVANKQRGVLVYDKEGNFVGELPQHIEKPISIYYCRDRASLWIGSAESHTLYEVDASTWEIMQTIQHNHLIHPAGFATYGDDLFVLSQDKDKLLRFSMSSGRMMEVVLDEVQDYGERLILSPC